jgi:hypothetical protein
VSPANKPPDFADVFEAVKRITEARGVRVPGEPLVSYKEGGLEFSRTAINEYEVRREGRLVFRAMHTGRLSSAPVFEPGEWVGEVRRIDDEIRRGEEGGRK